MSFPLITNKIENNRPKTLREKLDNSIEFRLAFEYKGLDCIVLKWQSDNSLGKRSFGCKLNRLYSNERKNAN